MEQEKGRRIRVTLVCPESGGFIRCSAQVVLLHQLEGEVHGLPLPVDGDGDGVTHPQTGQIHVADLIDGAAVEGGDDVPGLEALGGGVGVLLPQ